MNTRGRAAQFAEGRSAPSPAPRDTNHKQSKGRGKGDGSVAVVTPGPGGSSSAADILPGPGRSDEIPATAQPHEMVRYEHDDQDLGAAQTQILSGNGPQLTYKVNLTIPKYVPNSGRDEWERYTQHLGFYMDAIFKGKRFDLTSNEQTYTTDESIELYQTMCKGLPTPMWKTLKTHYHNNGADGFKHLDVQARGSLHRRTVEAANQKQRLKFKENMDINDYCNQLKELHDELIFLGIEAREKCARSILLQQINQLPERFDFWANGKQRIYLDWGNSVPLCIDTFIRELKDEDEILNINQLARNRHLAVHAAVATPQGGVPNNGTPAVNTTTPLPSQASDAPASPKRLSPGLGGSGHGRMRYEGGFSDAAKRREWQRPYQRKNYNYNRNRGREQNDYRPQGYDRQNRPTCSKCGKSGRGHTASECWQPDCTRCRTSSHTLYCCPRR